MLLVAEAEKIILSQTNDYGNEPVYFETAIGRVLAQNILADRDLPPVDRATMDGIGIKYASFATGCRAFKIKDIQAAGDAPVDVYDDAECVEIMTGAALAPTLDTIIRYEDLQIKDGVATVNDITVTKGQNLHQKTKDKKQGDVVATAGAIINAAIINAAASVGAAEIIVKQLPRTIIISTGNELVDVTEIPQPYQVRRSNSFALKAALQKYGLFADLLHIPDDKELLEIQLSQCINDYDVVIISGGVSMGKFDLIPAALQTLGVQQLFHKIQQRPGKPFWFGTHNNGLKVFAFPGNTVSAFMCLHRYFIPWLHRCMGVDRKEMYAVLAEDFTFQPSLQYFLQVSLHTSEQGMLLGTPLAGNGSGDFANLAATNAFMELPLEKTEFHKGEAYPIWPF